MKEKSRSKRLQATPPPPTLRRGYPPASSNAAPAEAKEENNQEPPTTTPAGEGQPPEAKAWESRKREVPPPNRQERRTPAQRYVDDYTRPGKKARAQRQQALSEAAQRIPPRPPPANRAANSVWEHEEWEGWQQWGDEHWSGGWSSSWWGASRDWEQAQSSGGDTSETSAEPDRASYEVQGEVRYLTILARGGSRVVYTLDREPRWVLKVGLNEAHHLGGSFLRWLPRSAGGSPSKSRYLGSQPRTSGPLPSSGWWPQSAPRRTVHFSRCAL